MKFLLLLHASFLVSFGTCQNVLFLQTDDSSVAELPCCQGDFVLSCQQINVEAAALGQDELDITPLNQTVKFLGKVGDSDHSYYYGNDDIEMVVTYHAEKEALYGHLINESNGDSYVIEFCGPKIHVLKQLDVNSMEENKGVEAVDVGGYSFAMDIQDGEVEDTTTIVTYSVKVYYTPQFRDATADIEGFIDQVIQVTNQGYINSQVPIRVKLHCSELATIDDIMDPSVALSTFASMKNTTKALRGTADVAALLVKNMKQWQCGIAYINGIYSDYPVSVTKKSCAIGTYVFGHELGHNLGLGHNKEQNINKYYPDGHGYWIREGHNWIGYLSIMAYLGEHYWSKTNYYSNPNVIHPKTGTVTGVWGVANNARVLTANRFAAAALGDESNKWCDITVDCSVSNGYRYFEVTWVGIMSQDRCVEHCKQDDNCIAWAHHKENAWCHMYQATQVDDNRWTTGPDLQNKECNLDTAPCVNKNLVLDVKKGYKSIETSTTSACHKACKKDGKCIQWDWNKETTKCNMHSGTYHWGGEYSSGPKYC